MKLKMVVGGKTIASVNITPMKIRKPGCIEEMVVDLRERYKHRIDADKKTVFYIDDVPSAMNKR